MAQYTDFLPVDKTTPEWQAGMQRQGQPQPYDQSGDLMGELGELDQMSVLMQQLQSNPQLAQLFQQAMGGMNQGAQQQMGHMDQLRQDILGGGYFGGAEEQTFRDLISGDTLREQGGTLYDMIEEQFAPKRNEARQYAASRGLGPGSGSAMSFEGQVQGAQQKSFSENMVNNYLDMVQSGTLGLGQMGTEQLGRQQSAGNIGQWLAQFGEGSQQNRMGIGQNITAQQMQPLMQLLQMHSGRRDQLREAGNPMLEGLTQWAPMGLDLLFPGAGTAMGMFQNAGGGGSGGGSYGQGPDLTDLPF